MVENKGKKNRKPTEQQLKVLEVLWQGGATSHDRATHRDTVWEKANLYKDPADKSKGANAGCCQTLRDNGFMRRTGTDPSTYHLYLTDAGIELCKVLEQEGLFENITRNGRVSATNGNTIIGLPKANDADEISDKTTAEDISEIYTDPRETEREAHVLARLGQGDFRKNVLRKWDECCCVTGATTVAVIRASHIKPWSKCDNQERLDPDNGLPLVATLDALFDRGFITFDQEGKLLVSTELAVDEVELFGLRDSKLLQTPSEKTAEYLEFHHTHVFKE